METITNYFNLIFNKIIGYTNPTIWTILILILILFRKFITNIIVKITYRIFSLDDDPNDSSVGKHLKAYIIFLGIYWIILIWLKDIKALEIIASVFKVISIIFATNILVDIISPSGILMRLSQRSKNKKLSSVETNTIMNNFLSKIIRIVLYIIAIGLILNDLGYNINGMVAGLGVGSAIMALAVQDIVKSFISGASILAEKPFVIGDYISIQDGSQEISGTVEDITLRNTKIRLLNNSLTYIPNLKMTSSCVSNYSKIENRRIDLTLQFPMDTTSEKLHRIMSKIRIYLESNPKVIKQTITVALVSLSVYSKDVRMFFYINESKYKRYLEILEDINFKIIEITDSENTRLAKPLQVLEINEKQDLEELRLDNDNKREDE